MLIAVPSHSGEGALVPLGESQAPLALIDPVPEGTRVLPEPTNILAVVLVPEVREENAELPLPLAVNDTELPTTEIVTLAELTKLTGEGTGVPLTSKEDKEEKALSMRIKLSAVTSSMPHRPKPKCVVSW
jgi:hypothetical protein